MKATLNHKRGVTIVSFEGFLNFSHPQKIKDSLEAFYLKKKNKKIVFNLEKLEFIGSSGIKPLIKIFKDLNRKRLMPRFYGLSPIYEKLFRAFEGRKKRFKIFKTETDALKSYPARKR